LPAPLQPGGISLIDDATDGTLTINHRVYTFLQSIIPDKGFMGKDWDGTAVSFAEDFWREIYRVLKPGGHAVVFGGTRTHHHIAAAIENAGFEIRDSLHWLYGSGFPKSHDVSKALDKAAGAERPVVGIDTRNLTSGTGIGSLQKAWKDNGGRQYTAGLSHDNHVAESGGIPITAPATALAARWAGWGTALKPAHEPIVLARKPLAGTVAATVAAWGTGGINVDACRVDIAPGDDAAWRTGEYTQAGGVVTNFGQKGKPYRKDQPAGRWPPNVLLTHSAACNGHCAPDCPVAALDRQSGERPTGNIRAGIYKQTASDSVARGHFNGWDNKGHTGDTGGASRFFPVLAWDPATDVPFAYVPKASRAERNAGCAGLPERESDVFGDDEWGRRERNVKPSTNHHPTVKPVALMRWLVRLVTPPGGTVLDPFAGSGSTGVACVLEGCAAILCEQDPDYLAIAQARIAHARQAQPGAIQAALLTEGVA
jgi:site-specific DNA-methyltransferase (adenine-specific)